MTNYRDSYYGSILDPIHGDIKLSEIEKWFISHPLFSRLRRVKQNTFLYYVFPSAIHTRFEHSIGVMHLSGKIFDACKENYATGVKKLQKNKENTVSSFFDLTLLGDENEEIYYQELRLAALLHDIGHGPLSHLFEKFLMTRDSFFNCVESEDYLNLYKTSFEAICIEGKNVEHEHISCVFILKMFNDLKNELVDNPGKLSDYSFSLFKKLKPERIVKLVESKFQVSDDYLDSKGNNYSSFFSKIISGFPLDADRMDYLLRDSYFSGVNYGLYDINRLFASFMASENEKKIELTIKESGIDSVLRFIQSRTHLFNQVYFHKTNRAANTMLAAATESKSDRVNLLDNTTVSDLQDFYTKNSDEYFINNTITKIISNNPEKESIIEDLKARKLFKRVYEHKMILSEPSFNSNSSEIDNTVDEIKRKLEQLGANQVFAFVDYEKNKAFKDTKDKSIKIAKKNRLNGKYTIDSDWIGLNKEFENASVVSIVVRVFLRRTFKNSSQFKSMKEQVLNTISDEINKIQSVKFNLISESK